MVNIIDFFRAIKRVYLDLTKERREAGDKLYCVKQIIKKYKGLVKTMKNVKIGLDSIYPHLPRPVRQTYVQQTMDLISYGLCNLTFDTKLSNTYREYEFTYRESFIKIYDNLVEKVEHYHDDMKKAYKKHDYKLCMKIYEDVLSAISRIQDLYIISAESYETYLNNVKKLQELEAKHGK